MTEGSKKIVVSSECGQTKNIKAQFSVESYLDGLFCFSRICSVCLGSGQGEGSVSDKCSSDSELGLTRCSLYWCRWGSGVTGALSESGVSEVFTLCPGHLMYFVLI